MRRDIEVLFTSVKNDYDSLVDNYNLNNFDSSDIDIVNINIKHILEDLESIYGYIAKDISDKYCHCIGKIYFQYAPENCNETDFINNKMAKNMPNVPTSIMNLILDVQHFRSNKKWLINLMALTNNVKHVELSVNKINVEKSTTYTDGETNMKTTGDLQIKPYANGYGFFGTGSIYNVGNISFYDNGIVKVGNGYIDVNNSSTLNLDVKYEERKVLQFKLIGNDVYTTLNEIIEETQLFISKLKKQL